MAHETVGKTGLSLRTALGKEGVGLVGTFVIIPRIEIVEIAAIAGFDLVTLDWEHGPYLAEASMPLIATAHRHDVFALVRVPSGRPELIGAALDLGADGVIVPHVDSHDRASLAVNAVRFPPEGDRSANPWVRAAGYSGSSEFFSRANSDAACITTIEGVDGAENAEAIIETHGVDAIFIGPVDLSASLGVPGQVDHPTVVATITDLIETAAERSVGVSIFAPTPEAAKRWLQRGARLVLLGVDSALTLNGFQTAISDLRAQ